MSAGGSFVSIPSKVFGLDDMDLQISNNIEFAKEFATSMQKILETSIEDLNDIVNTYNPPEMNSVDTTLSVLDRPVAPTKPSFEDFVSCVRDTICTKIKNDIVNGGTGITEPVYNAIIAREQEARRINQDVEYSRALDSVGSTGFNLPSGQVAGLQAELSRELLSKDQDSLNNVQIKDFDLANENTRFAVTQAIELEKLLIAEWETEQTVKVDTYKASIDGMVGEYNALSEWAKTEIAGIKVQAEVAIAEGKLGFDNYNIMIQLSERIAEAIANVSAQSVASALGAVNTNLSNSYSGSESRNEGWSHGETLSESHNFEQ